MDRDQIIRKIAAKLLFIETLDQRNSDQLDFHSLGVLAIRKALEAAYDAGRTAATRQDQTVDGSGHWVSMSVDEAAEHLKSWIDNLEPSDLALALIQVCGCPRVVYHDRTERFDLELP